MRSKENLLQQWHELARFWEDDASRLFEHQHLNELIECMEEIAREYEKFRNCLEDNQ